MSKVMVIGAGYVGLVTAACLAQKHSVVLVETCAHKRKTLEQGQIPFYEPGLSQLMSTVRQSGNLEIVDKAAQLLSSVSSVFLCVGTPPLMNGQVDMAFVWQAFDEVCAHASAPLLFINKSTVPIGTAQMMQKKVDKIESNKNLPLITIASNPEFLREGSAISDFMFPDRIIIGCDDSAGRRLLEDLYAPLTTALVLHVRPSSAELIKYAANSMLAMRISFINELSRLADSVEADILEVEKGVGLDKRIGPSFLKAGVGYGGSCFPKDVQALVCMGVSHGAPQSLASAAEQANEAQKQYFFSLVTQYFFNTSPFAEKRIGIWGLSFKPETDDTRFAPSIDALAFFAAQGCKVIVHDPVVQKEKVKGEMPGVRWASSAQEVLENSDVLCVMTDWQEYLSVPPAAFTLLAHKVVFDGRNCLDAQALIAQGITYYSCGRIFLSKNRQHLAPSSLSECAVL